MARLALEFDAETVAVDAADAVARQLGTEDAAPEWPRTQDVRRYRDAVLTRSHAMTDDKTKTAPEDTTLICLTDYEIAYGRKKFGVSDDRLAEAMRRFGHSAAGAETHLKK